MTDESRQIIDAIRFIAGVEGMKPVRLFIGTVTDVNEDDRECDVLGVLDDGSIQFEQVNLSPERNDGLIQIPAVDSSVICAMFPNGDLYVLAFSDIDKLLCYIDSTNYFEFDTSGFIWNAGTFGGLIKIGNLKTQWDAHNAATKSSISTALTMVDTQLTALGQPGGIAAAFATAAAAMLDLNRTTLENTKIQH